MRAETPTPLAFRHVHQVPGRQGDVGGQARALGAERILHDLDQDFIAFGDQRADVFGMRRLDAGIRVTRIEYVGRMQESGAFHADVDECRLHPGQYPRDPALVNVADQSAPAGALQKYLLQNAIFHHGGARLVHAGVDENISAHAPPTRHAGRLEQLRGFEQRQSHHAGIAALQIAIKIAAQPWMA